MKAKVKRPYIAKNGTLIEPGHILSNVDEDSKFIEGLLEHDFIEKVKDDLPKFKPLVYSKLAKVEIADQDYTEGNKKHFTFEEALEVEKKMKESGWRLPTRSEWVLICEEFGQNVNGELRGNVLMGRLNLKMNGIRWSDGDTICAGLNGNYWSASREAASVAHNLYFNASDVYPSDGPNTRYHGFSLRLVRDLGD